MVAQHGYKRGSDWLEGGWNRFGYTGQDGMNGFNPDGLQFLSLTTTESTKRQTTLYDAVRDGA